jgi:L-lactate permease
LIGFCDEDFKKNRPMWMIFVLSFLSAAMASFAISAILGPKSSALTGAIVGAAIALFWLNMSKLPSVLFENQPDKLYLIHAGFDIVSFMVMGAIVGYWR